MKLVEVILQETTNSSIPLSDILRKSKILANIFKNHELETWIDCELNGYKDDLLLPDYRKFAIHAKGTFRNIAYQTTAIIPPSCLDEKYR